MGSTLIMNFWGFWCTTNTTINVLGGEVTDGKWMDCRGVQWSCIIALIERIQICRQLLNLNSAPFRPAAQPTFTPLHTWWCKITLHIMGEYNSISGRPWSVGKSTLGCWWVFDTNFHTTNLAVTLSSTLWESGRRTLLVSKAWESSHVCSSVMKESLVSEEST